MIKKIASFLCLSAIFFFAGCSSEPAKKASSLKIGDSAPTFGTKDLKGAPVSMDLYAGNPVVLRFWSTDCKYCRADTPIFNRYFDKYKDKGLKVVYINRNSEEQTVHDFVADLDIVFPVVIDHDGSISKSYNIRLEPQTIVISPDHKILAAILGGVSETELESLIGKYLTD